MEKEKTKELLYLNLRKMLEADAINDFDTMERVFNQIRKFILNNEKQFTDAVAIDENEYLEDIKKIQNEWKERTEKALESEKTEDCIIHSNQNNMQLEQATQQLIMNYKDKCIESIKTYYDQL